MKVCLDSSVLIRACYPQNKENKWLRQQLGGGIQLLIPAVVVAEVLVKPSEEEREKLEALIGVCEVVAITETIARRAALLRAKAYEKESKVFLHDCLIAAATLEMKAKLATNNKSDFSWCECVAF